MLYDFTYKLEMKRSRAFYCNFISSDFYKGLKKVKFISV